MKQKISREKNVVAMSTIDANEYRRLNTQITQLSAICRLRDSRIYLHAIDQSQRIKQLQCITKVINNSTMDYYLVASSRPFTQDQIS